MRLSLWYFGLYFPFGLVAPLGLVGIAMALRRRAPGTVVAPRILTGFTDNWTFRRAGLQAYGFSPIMVGDEDSSRVHGNDERISLENIREGTRLYTELLLEMAAA
jgi:acetylornithine deacetylase/succinyl-diaminopimelate desuccinylase-like protein